MALGSETRRQHVIASVRRQGPFDRDRSRGPLEVALATAEFDLAHVLREDHEDHSRTVDEHLPPRGDPQSAFARGALLSSGSSYTLARNAIRCTNEVYDILSSATAQAMVPDDAYTEFLVEVLQALPMTTLPERQVSYVDHHANNARFALKARHLCPDPLPDHAIAAWDACGAWAATPPTPDEREAVYQAHRGVDWAEAHEQTPKALALTAALQVARGWGVTDFVVGALFGAGDTAAAMAAIAQLELDVLPAGPDPVPTSHDLADFGDVELVHILSHHFARACFQYAIARVDDVEDPHPHPHLAAPEDGVFADSPPARYRRAGERALELAHHALEHSARAGQLRAHADRVLAVATPVAPRDLWPLLRHGFASAQRALPDEAQSPMWKIPTLLFDLEHGEAAPGARVVTRGMAREFCGLP